MRVGKRHLLGPKSQVSIASLVERILAVAMDICNHECGPFWPNFAVFAIVCNIGTTISRTFYSDFNTVCLLCLSCCLLLV